MIDLYAWPTPNAHKVSFMLEETGLAYRVIAVDINQGDQFAPAFLSISPNGRIPAIVDHDGPDGPLPLFESGAILIYLAEKTGQFLPKDGEARARVLEWVMWQMGGLGPMCGQAHHFRNVAPEKHPYAIARFTDEVARLYGVMERRLGAARYLGGDDYSIADMASWSWVRLHKRQGRVLDDYPNLARWYREVMERPGTQRGMELLQDQRGIGPLTDRAREILFGETQFTRR